jgi:cell division septation protein DedD
VNKQGMAAQDRPGMKKQRGGTLLGFILGALAGLGVALALAVYITKVPMPFMTKAPSRTADDPAAEAKKNRDWDPNAALSGKPAVKEAGAVVDPAAAPAAPVAAGAPAPSADPVGDLVKAKADASAKAAAPPPQAAAPAAASANSAPAATAATSASAASPATAATGDPFNYFVQAGAFRTPEDAEQQRIKLSLMGLPARVSEREQSGRIVYRVRLGPFDKKDDADKVKVRLDTGGLEATLVRVQK